MDHGVQVPYVFNVMSSVLASVIIGVIFIIGLYHRPLIQRTSLRLQVAISVADLINHVTGIYYATGGLERSACVAAGFFRTFGRDLFCFYNLAIALNLQLVYLQGLELGSNFQYYYWFGPLLLGLVMNIPPLAVGLYGRGPKDHVCFINTSITGAKALNIINIHLVIYITFLYCSIIAVMVIYKLYTQSNKLKITSIDPSLADGDRTALIQKELKKLIIRVALYPTVAIVCLSGYVIAQAMSLANSFPSKDITNWSIYLSNLTGTVNFLAFLLDPSLHHAINFILKGGKARANFHNEALGIDMDKKSSTINGESPNQFTAYDFYETNDYKPLINQY